MNILLLDGGKDFGHSHGELNHTLHKKAKEVLTALGHNVQETVIDAGYDVEAEIEKFLWMDAVIWQMPGWWMHEPWTVKKYIDEVLTAGHGKLYHSDGRHRVNPIEGYGTGGLLQGKKTCSRLLGMRRLRPSPEKAIFSKAKAWMRCICTSTNSTSSSA